MEQRYWWKDDQGQVYWKDYAAYAAPSRLEISEFSPFPYLVFLRQERNQFQARDKSMESLTEQSSNIRIRLYKNAVDYETRYVAEVEAPLSPCGGLNLRDLPHLFQMNGTFEVCWQYSTLYLTYWTCSSGRWGQTLQAYNDQRSNGTSRNAAYLAPTFPLYLCHLYRSSNVNSIAVLAQNMKIKVPPSPILLEADNI